ncbi:MAG: nicotinate phosphoribosyltransferase [Clostridia bacterium]|nr:nicotinate phosphoribosyltransferase [Clostridia bacterium]
MRNLTMLTDLYQLTMMYGYYKEGMQDNEGIFDLFFRPKEAIVYAVMAGTESVVDYINNLHFSDEDIQYLRSLNLFDEGFLDYLKQLRFTGELYAMPEGTIVFPYEPLVRVRAPIMQAQLIETAMLTFVNHQTLIATKASRICYAANGDSVLEFGLRRAQGADAAIYGARAAIIGGCNATSNVLTGQMFDIPVSGTHAHSWVMSFSTELEAFRKYAEIYPSNCLLLVDTYDTLKNGVPNAIIVFNELKAKGYRPVGIRVDSGDLAYLTKQARKMLDEAGHCDVKIFASGDIDEHIISALKTQDAKIDVWGIGTKLITSSPQPSLGGVYKLAGIEENGVMVPKMKVSDTPEKITNPGFKTTYRIYGQSGMAAADLIALRSEVFDTSKPLTIFHPLETWKKKIFTDYTIKNLMVQVFRDGELIYDLPCLADIVEYAKQSKNELWEEYRRLINPHEYKVDLSETLYLLKQKLLNEAK